MAYYLALLGDGCDGQGGGSSADCRLEAVGGSSSPLVWVVERGGGCWVAAADQNRSGQRFE